MNDAYKAADTTDYRLVKSVRNVIPEFVENARANLINAFSDPVGR